MGRNITVYHSEPTIAETDVTIDGKKYMLYYKDPVDGYQSSYTFNNIVGSVTFEAKPDGECEFYKWVYRLENSYDIQRVSTDNEFTYSGDEGITIRAEGRAIDPVEDINIHHLYGTNTMYINIIGSSLIENYTYDVKGENGPAYEVKVDKTYDNDSRTLVIIVKGLDVVFDDWNAIVIEYTDKYSFSRSVDVYCVGEISSTIDDLKLISRKNGNWVLGWTKPDLHVYSFKYDYFPGGDITSSDINVECTCNLTQYGRGVTAYVDATPRDEYGSSYPAYQKRSNEIFFISAPPRPKVNITSTSNKTITGTFSLVNKFYDQTYLPNFYVLICLYLKNSNTVLRAHTIEESISGDFTFEGINPGEYRIEATSAIRMSETNIIWSVNDKGDSGEQYNFGSRYIFTQNITVSDSTQITPWSWEEGTGSDHDLAYQALTGHGPIGNFKYTVWNDLVDKVMEAITAKAQIWNTNGTTYLSYNDTKMTQEDRKLTAKRFNSLRHNIALREIIYNEDGVELGDKASGDEVFGEYFKMLAEALNDWISNINSG